MNLAKKRFKAVQNDFCDSHVTNITETHRPKLTYVIGAIHLWDKHNQSLIKFRRDYASLETTQNLTKNFLSNETPKRLIKYGLIPIRAKGFKSTHFKNCQLNFQRRESLNEMSKISNIPSRNIGPIKRNGILIRKEIKTIFIASNFISFGFQTQSPSLFFKTLMIFLCRQIRVEVWKSFVFLSLMVIHFPLDFWNHIDSCNKLIYLGLI